MLRKIYVDRELPLTDAEARAALRIYHAAEGPILERKIRAAIELVEARTGRALRQTRAIYSPPADCHFERNPNAISLPLYPVREVLAVEYRTKDGWQEVPGADYEWRPTDEGADVVFLNSFGFPGVVWGDGLDFIRIEFEAGYQAGIGTGTGDDPEIALPDRVLELVLMLAGHWYENREAVTTGDLAEVPLAAKMMFQELRIFR